MSLDTTETTDFLVPKRHSTKAPLRAGRVSIVHDNYIFPEYSSNFLKKRFVQ